MTVTITFKDGTRQSVNNVIIYYVRLFKLRIQTLNGWLEYDINNIKEVHTQM